MEEQKNNQQECACQEQAQTKKKGCLGKVLKATALVGAGAVVTHEVMTKGGWTKAAVKGVKALINKNKSDKDVAVALVETEDIYVPRNEFRDNGDRRFLRGDRHQFNNKH